MVGEQIMFSYPTPYSEVNAILDLLGAQARAILGDSFVGLYLYGSLASGDFDPQHSDIDFVVVTTTELPADTIAALEAMHLQLAASGSQWAAKLEGAYVSLVALRRHDPHGSLFPMLNEGRFYLAGLDSDWIIQRQVIHEHPVVVGGPDPRLLIDPVSVDDLRGAVKDILREWWAPMLDNPDWLRRTGYLDFAILTMCRVLYLFEYGTIVSKPVAARWAKEADRAWADLIEWALARPADNHYERLPEVQAFIRFTVEKGEMV